MLVVTRDKPENALVHDSVTVDALVHDARNPLNALSIALEVLSERMKREGGGHLSQTYLQCLRSMRENIVRVDRVLQCMVEQASAPSNPLFGEKRS